MKRCRIVDTHPSQTPNPSSHRRDPAFVRPALFLSFALLYLLGLLATSHAQPSKRSPNDPSWEQKWKEISRRTYRIQIQAPTQLSLFIQRDRRGRPVLLGRLVNDQDVGIANAALLLWLPNGEKHTLVTDEKGRYAKLASNWPKQGKYSLYFIGKGKYAPSRKIRQLDLGRIDLKLATWSPPTLDSGERAIKIRVRVTYRKRPVEGAPLTLFLRRPPKKEEQSAENKLQEKRVWPLMTYHTNEKGEVEFVWSGSPLQGPSRIRMLVRYPGNRFFLPQAKKIDIRILAPSHDQRRAWFWDLLLGLIALGSLAAVAFLTMAILRRRQIRMEQEQDDIDEHFPHYSTPGVRVGKRTLPTATDFGLQGRIVDDRERTPVGSVQFFLELPTEADPNNPIPFAKLETSEIAMDSVSIPPLAETSEPSEELKESAALIDNESLPITQERKDELVSQSSELLSFEVSQQELDALTNEDNARLYKHYGGIPLPESWEWIARSDPDGRFQWVAPKPGRYIFHLLHPHYRPKKLTLDVPHRGQLRTLKVRLTSYRTKIYEMYRKAVPIAQPQQTPDPQYQTAREILEELPHARAKVLRPLAELFEETYYAEVMPDSIKETRARHHFQTLTQRRREHQERHHERSPKRGSEHSPKRGPERSPKRGPQ